MLTAEERKRALIINLESAKESDLLQFKLEQEDIQIVLDALRGGAECQKILERNLKTPLRSQ
jgi:hypothetical protein